MRKITKLFGSALAIVLAFNVCAFANTSSMNQKEFLENLYENMDTEFGGAYFKDGVLHIVPLENSSEKSLNRSVQQFTIQAERNNCHIDEPQVYSYKELEDAFLTLRAHNEELNLSEYSIDIENNGLLVCSETWNAEKEQEVQELVGINNLLFVEKGISSMVETVEENLANDEEDVIISESSRSAKKKAKLGLEIFVPSNNNPDLPRNNNRWTIGRAVDIDADTPGFITAGHLLSVGDKISVSAYVDADTNKVAQGGALGKVIDVKTGDNVDAALIKLNSTSDFIPSALTFDGSWIESDSFPYQGYDAHVWARRKIVPVTITKQRVDQKYWNDEHSGGIWYYDLFQMKCTGNLVTESGDSGATVSLIWDDEEDPDANESYVGIYKGRSSDGYIYGCARKYIASYFDITSWQEP